MDVCCRERCSSWFRVFVISTAQKTMRNCLATVIVILLAPALSALAAEKPTADKIQTIYPPEKGFYAKRFDYEGIQIGRAHV